MLYSITVTGKRGNVEINNSVQAGIELGASRFKIQGTVSQKRRKSYVVRNCDVSTT